MGYVCTQTSVLNKSCKFSCARYMMYCNAYVLAGVYNKVTVMIKKIRILAVKKARTRDTDYKV